MTDSLVGTEAPDLTLVDQHGRRTSLESFRGSTVLLVFVPFAFSDTCTNELIDLRDAADLQGGKDLTVLVVSCDSIYTLKAWGDAYAYEAPLLSDFWPHGEASIAYGVFNESKGLSARGTFVIDPEGIVTWQVINPTGEARDIDDYRREIQAITAPAGR